MNAETTSTPRTRLLNITQVREKVSLSRPTIYRWMRDGRFPEPIKLTEGCVRWREGDIEAWIERHSSAA